MADPLKDNISSVTVLDIMGNDDTVVNAARVSMHKDATQYSHGDNAKLISYLARHNHWTPFSHPQIQLRIKMPIFIARQWFKHMVGFTRNEVSRRYVSDVPEIYQPKEWRLAADSVKQGSSEETFPGTPYCKSLTPGGVTGAAVRMYNSMIDTGICPEQARMVLPQSMYTEFVETGSLAAYARLCKLRLDPHAQKEVRLYAEAVSSIIAESFPVSWEALNG